MSFNEATEVEIITTEDGSHSLYRPSLDETYHSTYGAIKESQHVFVQQGLAYFSKQSKKAPINILEVGLGTGLNLLLSAVWAKNSGAVISYTALEPFPLQPEIFNQLNYPHLMGKTNWERDFKRIHTSPWEEQIPIGPEISFIKSQTRLEEFIPQEIYDIVYFDAFSPSTQPEIWSKTNLTKLYKTIGPDGLLVTYCAQGKFKRDLQLVGFEVESLSGPPGKFEMVRAIKAPS